MFGKLREQVMKHVQNNAKTYFFLFLTFVLGVSAGAFTVNGLSTVQRDELANYFNGFLQLLGNQKVDASELLKVSAIENAKIVLALWVLGVTIIGVPFIFLVIGIRGFITGFSTGFIIKAIGLKGILFTFITLLPKEIIVVPCIIAIGVSGINFSRTIISKGKGKKHRFGESLKSSFFAYSFVIVFFTILLSIGILMEAYIAPVLIRAVSPIIVSLSQHEGWKAFIQV